MFWVLFFIGIKSFAEPPILEPIAVFESMDECFKAREAVVEKIGKPIINYQVVCVAHDATDQAI